jgi:hypothetical protein
VVPVINAYIFLGVLNIIKYFTQHGASPFFINIYDAKVDSTQTRTTKNEHEKQNFCIQVASSDTGRLKARDHNSAIIVSTAKIERIILELKSLIQSVRSDKNVINVVGEIIVVT